MGVRKSDLFPEDRSTRTGVVPTASPAIGDNDLGGLKLPGSEAMTLVPRTRRLINALSSPLSWK